MSAPLFLVVLAALFPAAPERPFIHAPASNDNARHDPISATILPNGRWLCRIGLHVAVA